MMKDGAIQIQGKRVLKPGQKLRLNDQIVIMPPPPLPLEPQPEPIPLEILFEDPFLLVINKPGGLVTHPGAGHPKGTLLNAILYHIPSLKEKWNLIRAGIVHRLDKGTSGAMVIAKDEETHRELASQFKQHTVKRIYLLISRGVPQSQGVFESLHGRNPCSRIKFSSKVKRGRFAKTCFEVIEDFKIAALVQARPLTGRTHQIRVHFSDNGFPLLGDMVYGRKPRDKVLQDISHTLKRQALHAYILEFFHPKEKKIMRFVAPIPEDFQNVLQVLRTLKC
jgi:23S rRNA pseudouridine1911/1915/1917 synthase